MSRELRPTNVAEAFIKAVNERARYATAKRVMRAIERPGVGLVDNSTGRPVRRISKDSR